MAKERTFKVTIEMAVNAPGLDDTDLEAVKVQIAGRVRQMEHWNYWFSSRIVDIKIEES